ncbi:hypothetical protein COLO4_20361 [Corchorus olitorius]|uniref:Leucine-rich repeat-containing N-terminal plant-type domain-containing protein n=1 Tax=Corchorus olitorius TaxID=93759 RepID=A0A1R3J063_9ROSI|nr:hypothetical protein COLO4_20361 [Corchorus olitorius]
MASRNAFFQLLFIFFLCYRIQILEVAGVNSSSASCIKMEREALLKFKEYLIDPFDRLSSWVGKDCCNWAGVACDNHTGNVYELDLGTIYNCSWTQGSSTSPYWYCKLGGTLNPSLLNLTYLKYLDLSENNFLGISIPSFLGSLKKLEYLNLRWSNFSGMVPPHLGNLSNLIYLDLNNEFAYPNYLWVSDLNWLFCLSSMKYLGLRDVNLSKVTTNWLEAVNMLPSLLQLAMSSCELSSLLQTFPFVNFTSLVALDLSYNRFNSPVPQWLFNISTLKALKIRDTYATGPIPKVLSGNLCKLRMLDMSFNSIEGLLPKSIGNLSRLEVIDLSFNMMSGFIPGSMGQLRELFKHGLYGNSNFQGAITETHLQNLTKLLFLSISSVNKSLAFSLRQDWIPPFSLYEIAIRDCQVGPDFPAWLRTQKRIMEIALSNVDIFGNIPNWIWTLSPYMFWLDISHNQLRGKLVDSIRLPFSIAAWIDLGFNNLEGSVPLWLNVTNLSLRNNLFYGPIPSNIGHEMSELQNLDLSRNHLNDSIPPSINNIRDLRFLDLSSNYLSGTIPKQWNGLKNLMTVDLSKNNLSGSILGSLCSLRILYWLKLSGNNLSGELSTFLGHCNVLFELDLRENGFSGTIPQAILADPEYIYLLNLRANKLTGTIPEQICNLENLHILDLAHNNLSGPIPPCLGGLIRLKYLRNNFIPSRPTTKEVIFCEHTELVIKGRKTEYTKIILLVNTIDLSGNSLVGEILDEITNLSALGSLNLSWNQLTGKIPENIGSLQRLEALDLSHNHLSGPLPPSISSMTLLNHLNLSYNNLSGQIPSSHQLQTIVDPSIYEGNPRLCGPPLLNNCSTSTNGNGVSKGKVDEDESSQTLWIYISAALGFVVGFWAVFGTLVVKKSVRHAYFKYLDEISDKTAMQIAVNVARFKRKMGVESIQTQL